MLAASDKAFGVGTADVQDAFSTATSPISATLPGAGIVPLNVARICTWTWMRARSWSANIHANAASYQVIAAAAFEQAIGSFRDGPSRSSAFTGVRSPLFTRAARIVACGGPGRPHLQVLAEHAAFATRRVGPDPRIRADGPRPRSVKFGLMAFFPSSRPRRLRPGVRGGRPQHEATHELLAGAAAFEAMRMYEHHREREGIPEHHEFARNSWPGSRGGRMPEALRAGPRPPELL